jgi:hypothetical protein
MSKIYAKLQNTPFHHNQLIDGEFVITEGGRRITKTGVFPKIIGWTSECDRNSYGTTTHKVAIIEGKFFYNRHLWVHIFDDTAVVQKRINGGCYMEKAIVCTRQEARKIWKQSSTAE